MAAAPTTAQRSRCRHQSSAIGCAASRVACCLSRRARGLQLRATRSCPRSLTSRPSSTTPPVTRRDRHAVPRSFVTRDAVLEPAETCGGRTAARAITAHLICRHTWNARTRSQHSATCSHPRHACTRPRQMRTRGSKQPRKQASKQASSQASQRGTYNLFVVTCSNLLQHVHISIYMNMYIYNKAHRRKNKQASQQGSIRVNRQPASKQATTQTSKAHKHRSTYDRKHACTQTSKQPRHEVYLTIAVKQENKTQRNTMHVHRLCNLHTAT
jgi:hypothetical protein